MAARIRGQIENVQGPPDCRCVLLDEVPTAIMPDGSQVMQVPAELSAARALPYSQVFRQWSRPGVPQPSARRQRGYRCRGGNQ